MSLPSSTGLEHLAGIQIVIQHLPEHFHSISKLLAGQIAHEPVSFGIESGNYLRPFRFSFSFPDLTERDRVSYSPNRIDPLLRGGAVFLRPLQQQWYPLSCCRLGRQLSAMPYRDNPHCLVLVSQYLAKFMAYSSIDFFLPSRQQA
jgi:hypothetical protein